MAEREYQYIQYEVDGGKARITLNRPDKRNALSIDLVEELRDATGGIVRQHFETLLDELVVGHRGVRVQVEERVQPDRDDPRQRMQAPKHE